MKVFTFIFTTFLLTISSLTYTKELFINNQLNIIANTPELKISRRSNNQDMINISSLEYDFKISGYCKNNLTAKNIRLNITDTSTLFNIQEENNFQIESLKIIVPASQIAPIVLGNFCTIRKINNKSSKKIYSILSLQASLSCVNDKKEEVNFFSKTLDATLICIN